MNELLIVSKSCSKMVKGFRVVKVLRGSTLWYLHFPLTCESYLPALALCSCGDVPTPLGAESSGKWFPEWPPDTTCWALIDSCGRVKPGTKPYTVTWHWPWPAQSLPAHLEEHWGHRAPTNKGTFFFHWSGLTDPETELVTHHSMNLHTVVCSVHFSNRSNQISILSCTRAECIPFSPLMERQGTRIEFLLLDVCSSGFENKILQSFK